MKRRKGLRPADYQSLLLGAFIRHRKYFDKLSPELNEDLFDSEYKPIFEALIVDSKISLPELAESVDHVGGVALIRDVVNSPKQYGVEDITLDDVKSWARRVDSYGRLRQIKTLCGDIGNSIDLESPGTEVDQDKLVSKLVNRSVEIYYRDSFGSGFKPYNHYLAEYVHKLKRTLAGESIGRVPTGFKSFDLSMGGGLPNGLVIVGGVPGSGKTQWCIQVAKNVAAEIKNQGVEGVVAINSVEMSGVGLAQRLILSEVEVDSARLATGGYNDDKEVLGRIKQEIIKQAKYPIMIDDSDFLTSKIIASRVSGLLATYKEVVLIVTDFAELVADSGESQEEKVANVYRNAKALSKRLNCPVIVISQLSRAVDASGSRVPTIRQLRFSGMAEALADMIILPYYPYEYVNNGIKITPHPQMPPTQGISYLIIGKHRDGPTGVIPMGWRPEVTKWSDRRVKLIDSIPGETGNGQY